jgi:peroxiredoxin
VLRQGDRIPDVSVWAAPHERVALADLAADGEILLLFYLFDWSST